MCNINDIAFGKKLATKALTIFTKTSNNDV